MRICLLTREFPPVTSYTGGIGTHFAALAVELASQGHDVHAITVGDHPERAGELDGVAVHPLSRPSRRIFLEDWLWARAADAAVVREGPFDVVYAAEFGGDAAEYSFHRAAGPLVTNLTTSTRQILSMSPGRRPTSRERLAHMVLHRLERQQTEQSDGLVACSQAILDWSRSLWNLRGLPSVVLPNMVDAERVRALGSGSLPDGYPRDDGPVVAFSGRVEIRKGAHVLGAAMREVWEELPSANLVLMGRDTPYQGGSMGDHLRELAGPHADRVLLLGNQPPERLFAGLAAADIVVLPSIWENFAVAALEALALGRPVVASATGGFLEMVTHEHDGLLVPPGDSSTLARALLDLLGDRERRERLGEAAATTALEYQPGPVARRHVEWFEAVAGTA